MGEPSGIVDLISAAANVAAVAVAVGAILYTRHSETRQGMEEERRRREALTTRVWEMWSSGEFRGFRARAWKHLNEIVGAYAGRERPLMAPSLLDLHHNEAVGGVEHFIVEVAALHDAGVLDPAIFKRLFENSLLAWAGLLLQFDRTKADAFQEDELKEAFERLFGVGFENAAAKAYGKAVGHYGRPIESAVG